jgi:RNA polymerase sigma-70 factor (ECF subfamily)
MSPNAQPNPTALIDLARKGDPSALGQLLELFRNYLKLLARLQIDHRLQGKVGPSDLVQETFLQTHRQIATFRGTTEAEFLQWLRQILVRTIVDRVQRYYGRDRRDVRLEQSVHREVDRSSQMLRHELAVGSASPSEQAERREESVMLADALQRLPEAYREVLVLRHLQQLTFPEVAERMDRSLDSVNKLWARALAALRAAMGEPS